MVNVKHARWSLHFTNLGQLEIEMGDNPRFGSLSLGGLTPEDLKAIRKNLDLALVVMEANEQPSSINT